MENYTKEFELYKDAKSFHKLSERREKINLFENAVDRLIANNKRYMDILNTYQTATTNGFYFQNNNSDQVYGYENNYFNQTGDVRKLHINDNHKSVSIKEKIYPQEEWLSINIMDDGIKFLNGGYVFHLEGIYEGLQNIDESNWNLFLENLSDKEIMIYTMLADKMTSQLAEFEYAFEKHINRKYKEDMKEFLLKYSPNNDLNISLDEKIELFKKELEETENNVSELTNKKNLER